MGQMQRLRLRREQQEAQKCAFYVLKKSQFCDGLAAASKIWPGPAQHPLAVMDSWNVS